MFSISSVILYISRRDSIVIYVTLPSNSSIDIYSKNKISSFKVNLSETLQVYPEHWEVALKEIQFRDLLYNLRKDKNYLIGWYNTVIGHPSNKRVVMKLKSVWTYTNCISVYGKYGAIYSVICLHRYHSESVRALLLGVVPVKSGYVDITCVAYEQPEFCPLRRTNIQTVKINIRIDTDELVSLESGTSIMTLVFRRK